MLDIHEELRLLCERQGEALKKLAAERDDARAQRDAAIETAAHIGRERDTLKAAAEAAEGVLDSLVGLGTQANLRPRALAALAALRRAMEVKQ